MGCAGRCARAPSRTWHRPAPSRRRAKDRFVQGGVDVLPLACLLLVAQRQQDPDGTVEAGQVIAERGRARRHRGLPRHTREIRQAADGVRDAGKAGPVPVGAGLAVTGDPQHDQARVELVQHLPAKAPFLERSGRKFSHKMSDSPTSFLKMLGPSGVRRSTVTDFLLRASLSQASVSPRWWRYRNCGRDRPRTDARPSAPRRRTRP